MRFLNILLVFLLMLGAFKVDAGKVTQNMPRPMAGNPHIKLLTYNPRAIHYYKGFYGYESSILFEPGEEFEIIAMGDPKGWQLNPMENRLFLKPIDTGANTNATIITRVRSTDERRIYLFELHADEAKDVHDEELAYEVRMVYPSISYSNQLSGEDDITEASTSSGRITTVISGTGVPDPSNPRLNYNYTIAGDKALRPMRVFDDGRFTYALFGKTQELPAFFSVDIDGYEVIVNWRRVNDYIVIESVESVFVLRNGGLVGCLFNEDKPYVVRYTAAKRSKGVFSQDK